MATQQHAFHCGLHTGGRVQAPAGGRDGHRQVGSAGLQSPGGGGQRPAHRFQVALGSRAHTDDQIARRRALGRCMPEQGFADLAGETVQFHGLGQGRAQGSGRDAGGMTVAGRAENSDRVGSDLVDIFG